MAVGALLLALVLFVAFGLNALKGPITKRVSEATGRELVIEGDLRAMWSWVHPRFRVERISFANAPWGRAPHLLKAEAIEASVSVLPLLTGRVVLPELHLVRAEVSLEQTADGKKNWIMEEKPEPKEESRLVLQRLTLDHGLLDYLDAGRGIDLTADLSTDETGVNFNVVGSYSRQPVQASGHAGHVLSLRDASTAFPLKGQAKVGATELAVDGTVTGIIGLQHVDAKIELAGRSLDDLYEIIRVALPRTSAYRTAGRLLREKDLVRYEDFTAKVGESDLAGYIEVNMSGERPFMKGDLHAKVLNLADLGPLVGASAGGEDRP
ncbi:MAG TPA: AsmA family protein, partial [Burkholderiales bacterium]|nr:AsmA family protein [Burkholderiales bacterium]